MSARLNKENSFQFLFLCSNFLQNKNHSDLSTYR